MQFKLELFKGQKYIVLRVSNLKILLILCANPTALSMLHRTGNVKYLSAITNHLCIHVLNA